MKKVLSMLFVFSLMFIMSVNVFADNGTMNSEERVEEVSFEEYVRIYAETEKITFEDAKLRILEDNKKILTEMNKKNINNKSIMFDGFMTKSSVTSSADDSSIIYRNMYYTRSTPAGDAVEVGALVKMYTQSSFQQIVGVEAVYSSACDSGAYSWAPNYDPIAEFTPSTVTIYCSGYIVRPVDVSTSHGVSIGTELLGFGYEGSFEVGKTTNFRYRLSCDNTMSIY